MEKLARPALLLLVSMLIITSLTGCPRAARKPAVDVQKATFKSMIKQGDVQNEMLDSGFEMLNEPALKEKATRLNIETQKMTVQNPATLRELMQLNLDLTEKTAEDPELGARLARIQLEAMRRIMHDPELRGMLRDMFMDMMPAPGPQGPRPRPGETPQTPPGGIPGEGGS